MASLHLAAVIRPCFGNSDCVKCVVSEHGDTVYVKDVSLLLQLLDIEHPIGQLLVAACQSHSHRYGSGVKSLLVLHGLLTEAYQSLCEQGIPSVAVITLMRESLSDSMCILSGLQIPLTDHLHATRHNHPHTDSTLFRALPAKSDDFKEVIMSHSEKRIDKDDRTFVKYGSDIKDLGETELIHLKMKEVHEDEDYIGCFLHDLVPSKEKKNEEAQAGLTINDVCIKVRDEIQLTSRLSDADQHDSDFDDCFEDQPSKHPSVTVCEDRVEASPYDTGKLDACFSQGIAEIEPTHVEGFVSLNDRYSEGTDQKTSDRTADCSMLISSQNHSVTEVVEDDFDSCFEDRELDNKVSTDTAVTDCTTERTDCTTERTDCTTERTDCTTERTDCTTEKIEADIKSLNSLLKRIKSTKTDSTNVFLSSRHFKQQAVSDAESSDGASDVLVQPTDKLSGMDVHKESYGKQGDDIMPVTKKLKNKFQSELERLNNMVQKVKSCQQKFSETHLQTACSGSVAQHSVTSLSAETKMLDLVNLKKSQKRVLNSSRYFKTVESTLARMTMECADAKSDRKTHYKVASSAPEGYDFELSLQKKLSQKGKEGIRNSSPYRQHFKAFNDVSVTWDLGDRNLQDENRASNTTDVEGQTDGVQSRDQVCSVNHSDQLIKGIKEVSSDDVQSSQSVHAEVMTLSSGQVLFEGADDVSGKGLESLQQASGMIMLHQSLGSDTSTPHPSETRDGSGRMKLEAGLLSATCTTHHRHMDELSQIPALSDNNSVSTVRCWERTLPSGETHFPLDSDVPLSAMCWCEVADGLSHGCPEMMKLVVQAAASQMAMTSKHVLNLKLLHTCAVGGTPVRHTGVVPGLVVRCDSHTLSHVLSYKDKCWNVLLLNGDLNGKFRHKGYKDAVKGSYVGGVESVGHLSRQDQWLQHCVERLTELSVGLVLVKGLVDERVTDTLTASGVVTIHSVPFRVLEALREATATELCVYVTEASKSHVCESVHVRSYFPSWCDHLSSHDPQAAHIVLDTAKATALQTIVLCHPSSHANDIQEQEVDLCSHRLANALHDGMVLPGGGEAEKFCADYLQKRCSKTDKVTSDLDLYRPVVTEAMADIFHKMGKLVTNNCAQPQHTESPEDHRMLGSSSLDRTYQLCNPPHTNGPSQQHSKTNKHDSSFYSPLCDVQGISCKNRHGKRSLSFDNYNSKMAAWSAAMDAVAMVTQTDVHVVTGVSSDEDGRCGIFLNGITL
ncbi:uncharacterized protein [Haliotis asinina]|uniref:uncharacterized protein n=1 Tax=Haliotis asinina TaxID=109174 RepID=UPI003532275C